jgi:hypothetical protein
MVTPGFMDFLKNIFGKQIKVRSLGEMNTMKACGNHLLCLWSGWMVQINGTWHYDKINKKMER